MKKYKKRSGKKSSYKKRGKGKSLRTYTVQRGGGRM